MSPLTRFRSKMREDGPGQPLVWTTTDLFTGKLLTYKEIPVDPDFTSSEVHLCYDEVHRKVNGAYRDGGPLRIEHRIKRVKPVFADIQCRSSLRHRCTGLYYPMFVGVPVGYQVSGGLQELTVAELAALGTTGWSRFRPGRPEVSLTSSLVELRELPQMLRRRLSDFRGYRGTGKAYLEWKFGWESLMRDIQSMYKLYKNIDRRLAAIKKHNGKWSNRKGIVLSDVSCVPYEQVGNTVFGFFPAPSGDTIQSSLSSVKGIARKELTVWFEGRFRFYIPESEMMTDHWRRDTIRKMFGATLTPDHAWELIPWSWLVDYFTNVGDVFSNLSGGYVDAIAKYAYVMATSRHTVTQHSSFVDRDGVVYTGTIESDLVLKQRMAASPFGFGMDIGSLSDAQNMILAALGISKLRL